MVKNKLFQNKLHSPNLAKELSHDTLKGNKEDENKETREACDTEVRPEKVNDNCSLQRTSHQIGTEKAKLIKTHAIVSQNINDCAHRGVVEGSSA